MSSSAFEDFLRGGRNDRPEPRKSPPDVLCVTLREALKSFAEPCSFKVGDLVTPRANGSVKLSGDPHIVIEARPEADHDFNGDPDSNSYGKRRDLRVLCETQGRLITFWVEAADFEPYTGPGAAQRGEA